MKKFHTHYALILLSVLALPLAAHATEVADCDTVFGLSRNESYKADPKDVQQCISRGYDAPVNWRPGKGRSAGVKVPGSRGFSYGTVVSPEQSPGAIGADASVLGSVIGFINRFNRSSSSGSSNSGDSLASCPVSQDNSGIYGAKQALTGSSTNLTCGGAVPLATYELILNRGTDSIATTERGSYYIWAYRQNGSTLEATIPNPVRLPTYLCIPGPDVCGSDGEHGTSCSGGGMIPVPINAPVAQMVSFRSDASAFYVHLISEAEGGADALSTVRASEPEHYLKIPLEGGIPKVPHDCDLLDDYYKTVDSLVAEVVVHAAIKLSCADNPAVLSGAPCKGMNATAVPNASCDTVSTYPTGAPAGVVCDGKVQYAVLDRTTIMYPPGSVPSLVTFPDAHTAMLVRSTDNAKIYAQAQTVFELFPAAPPMNLNEGFTTILPDGSRFMSSGPTTYIPSTHNVSYMAGGGVLLNPSGALVQQFPNGGSFVLPIPPTVPTRVQLGSSLTLPPGYLLMTQPSPYVRLPIDRPAD